MAEKPSAVGRRILGRFFPSRCTESSAMAQKEHRSAQSWRNGTTEMWLRRSHQGTDCPVSRRFIRFRSLRRFFSLQKSHTSYTPQIAKVGHSQGRIRAGQRYLQWRKAKKGAEKNRMAGHRKEHMDGTSAVSCEQPSHGSRGTSYTVRIARVAPRKGRRRLQTGRRRVPRD
jgi:hypothetical protein